MKVMIVGHSYLARENQKQLTCLGQHVEIEVASPRSFRGMIFDYDLAEDAILGEGWKIRLYDKIVPPGFPEAAYVFKSLTLGLREFKPDIVHIEADPFSPVFMDAFTLARYWVPNAKVVCTVKQNTYTSRGPVVDGIKDFVARRLVPRVDRFITVNRGVAEIYRERFGAATEKMTYCTHLGVDTDIFCPAAGDERDQALARFSLARGKLLIGYCGRLVDYKGVPDLIDAVKLLRENTQQDYRLALLGNGPMRSELAGLARENSWLQLLDPIAHADVAQFLKALDLFVMPPRILPWHVEHDAHALLEAMATGLPCVATRCGAIEDVLPEAGILVEPEMPTALCDAMNGLLSGTDSSFDLGGTARKKVVEQYSLAAVAQTYFDVYRRILA